MGVQLDYSYAMKQGVPGTMVDLSVSRIDSYAAAVDGIKPGMGLTFATDSTLISGNVKPPTTANEAKVFAGVALQNGLAHNLYTGVVQFNKTDTVPVVNAGRVYVTAVGAVAAGELAFVIWTAGATQGQFCSTNNAETGKVATKAIFRQATDVGGGLTILEMGGNN